MKIKFKKLVVSLSLVISACFSFSQVEVGGALKIYPYVGEYSVKDSVIKIADLLEMDGITAMSEDGDEFKVASFDLNIHDSSRGRGHILVGGRSANSKFTGKMKHLIKYLQKGDKLYIENIKVLNNVGETIPAGELSFRVI